MHEFHILTVEFSAFGVFGDAGDEVDGEGLLVFEEGLAEASDVVETGAAIFS